MREAYSLLELMAVVALIALFFGISTVNMRGVSDDARLRVTADQIAAAFRLAVAEAARSGRPHVLLIETGRCVIRRPARSDAGWRWETGGEFRLPPKVTVRAHATDGSYLPQREVSLPVAPGPLGSGFLLRLEVAGAPMMFKIDATGAEQWLEEGQ